MQQMMPPQTMPIPRLAEETGISAVTLYSWRKQARVEGIAVPAAGKNPEKWSSQDKPLSTHCASGPNQVWCWDITWLPVTCPL